MQIYYHNTIASNPANMVLGYLTSDGDFIPNDEYSRLKSNAFKGENDVDIFGSHVKTKIMVESGLLACEPIEQFYQRVAKKAKKNET